jgi:uncharacterized Zn finger protein
MANIIDASGMQQQPSAQVRIDPNSLKDVSCVSCNGKLFQEVYMFKKISAIVSPTGRDEMIPVVTYRCVECGDINPEFLPKMSQ